MTGDDTRDPVAKRLSGEDLYDIAEWEQRGILDSVATTIYGAIRTGSAGLLVLVATLLLVAQVGVIGYAILIEPSLGVLTLISVVPAILLVGFVWYQNETMREPWGALAATFLLAIVFASFAATLNTALKPVFTGFIPVFGLVIYFFLVVAPGEEFVKLLAVRTYAYNADGFDAVIDGAVYGAVAGLGFATVENALYITQGALQAGSITTAEAFRAAVGTATSRAFVGPGHVIYSAFAGYYLGLAKFNPDNAGPIVVKGLVIAALIHATYNSIVTYAPLSGFVFVGFILLYDGFFGYLLYRKLSRYGDYYRRATEEESDEGTGTDGESDGSDTEETAGSDGEGTAAGGDA